MTDPHAHAYTRLRAATGILTFAYQGQAQADLHARCAALETALAALQDAAPAPPPALACNLDFAVLTPEDERLARLEAEMAAQQRRAEEQQRKAEELRQQRAASAAHWQAYTQALPPLPSRVVQEVREAWPTFPDLRVTETHCAYTPRPPGGS